MLNCDGKRVFPACGFIDGRKGIDGLAPYVREPVKPDDAAIHVFCSRKRDTLRILEWDGTGFQLRAKLLETGHFQWPRKSFKGEMMEVAPSEFPVLVEGAKLTQKFNRKHCSAFAAAWA